MAQTLWLYNNAAWGGPASMHAYKADGTWGLIDEAYVFRNNQWQKIYKQYSPNISTSNSLLNAVFGREPHFSFWYQQISGPSGLQFLGDLNGNGSISTLDANYMLIYTSGGSVPTNVLTWITNYLVPYVNSIGGDPYSIL